VVDIAALAANCSGGIPCAIQFDIDSDNVITPANCSDLPEQLMPFQSTPSSHRQPIVPFSAASADPSSTHTIAPVLHTPVRGACGRRTGCKPGRWREILMTNSYM
jgi:hypothetical protein